MSDSTDSNLVDQLGRVHDHAMIDPAYRADLLANPEAFLAKQNVDLSSILHVSAEYHDREHGNYGLCMLITEKSPTSASPAPESKDDDKSAYDFLDCHHF